MDNYNGYIYIITNKVNGMKYIGRHYRRSLDTDILNDGYLGSGGRHYQYARAKYGDENFIKEILDEGPYTLEEAMEREKYWISYYNAVEDPMFYNICCDSNPPNRSGVRYENNHPLLGRVCINNGVNLKFVRETELDSFLEEGWTLGQTTSLKSKLSTSAKTRLLNPKNHPMYGKHHSEITRKKLCESASKRVGKDNPMYGKHHSEEFKMNKSAKYKGRVWVHKGSESHQIDKESLDDYLSLGYVRGRGKSFSEESKKKLSDSIKRKYEEDPTYRERVSRTSKKRIQ